MRGLRFLVGLATGFVVTATAMPALGQYATRTMLSAAPSPSIVGQRVILTANVDALGGKSPTGSVTFYDAATRLGVAQLSDAGAGQATLSAGGLFSCALTSAGGLKCWGWNATGQLGDGTFTSKTSPVNVSGLLSGVTAIDAGHSHACALTAAGGVKCWGYNAEGAVGDGTNTNRNAPVYVSGLASGAVSVSAGGNHSCAVTWYGSARCWGWNRDGQIGDGTSNNVRLTPRAVFGLASGVVAVSMGRTHSCALTFNGAVKCWGANAWGELGNNKAVGSVPIASRPVAPVAVVGLASGAVAVAVGEYHSCALLRTGSVRCWGLNVNGQIGDGTIVSRPTPVATKTLAALLRARARFAITTLAAGPHTLRATYSGDATHRSSAGAVWHKVN